MVAYFFSYPFFIELRKTKGKISDQAYLRLGNINVLTGFDVSAGCLLVTRRTAGFTLFGRSLN